MRNFIISIDIDAPAERVWNVTSDVERWPEWTPSVTSVKRMGNEPFAVGTRVVIKQPKFPPAIWKVTSIEPGKSFTWVSSAPGLRVIGHHAVAKVGAGSRATLSLELEGLFGGVWGRLTRDITLKYIGFEANGLKARSENPSYSHNGMIS
jgi:uncharacterized protein YndB with AHSA1/START domain